MKHILILLTTLITFGIYTQTNVIINNTLTIPHGDITLYLDKSYSFIDCKGFISITMIKLLFLQIYIK